MNYVTQCCGVINSGQHLVARRLEFHVTSLVLLVVAQLACANEARGAEELPIYVEGGATVAENLSAHAAMMTAAIHRKGFFASIADFTKPIGHPKFVLWSFHNFFLLCNFHFRCSKKFSINQDGKEVLLAVSG